MLDGSRANYPSPVFESSSLDYCVEFARQWRAVGCPRGFLGLVASVESDLWGSLTRRERAQRSTRLANDWRFAKSILDQDLPKHPPATEWLQPLVRQGYDFVLLRYLTKSRNHTAIADLISVAQREPSSPPGSPADLRYCLGIAREIRAKEIETRTARTEASEALTAARQWERELEKQAARTGAGGVEVGVETRLAALTWPSRPLAGREFEEFVYQQVRQRFPRVELTPRSGDFGLDLIVTTDGDQRWGIQVKHLNANVGVSAVQAAFAGMAHYGLDKAAVLSSLGFSSAAEQHAAKLGVRLIRVAWER